MLQVTGACRKPDHQAEIDPGADRGRQRETDLRQRSHQQDLERDIDRGGDQRGLHRRRGVAARKEGRDRAADQHEGQQTEGVSRERAAGGIGIGGA